MRSRILKHKPLVLLACSFTPEQRQRAEDSTHTHPDRRHRASSPPHPAGRPDGDLLSAPRPPRAAAPPQAPHSAALRPAPSREVARRVPRPAPSQPPGRLHNAAAAGPPRARAFGEDVNKQTRRPAASPAGSPPSHAHQVMARTRPPQRRELGAPAALPSRCPRPARHPGHPRAARILSLPASPDRALFPQLSSGPSTTHPLRSQHTN